MSHVNKMYYNKHPKKKQKQVAKKHFKNDINLERKVKKIPLIRADSNLLSPRFSVKETNSKS